MNRNKLFFIKSVMFFISFGFLIERATASEILPNVSSELPKKVETQEGYLLGSKRVTESDQEGLTTIVFLREKAQNANIPTIFVNDREVTSLAPNRYSETQVCSRSTQSIRIGSRAQAVEKGKNSPFEVSGGKINYVQIYEIDAEKFGFTVLSKEQAEKLMQRLSRSHLINRHQPKCS